MNVLEDILRDNEAKDEFDEEIDATTAKKRKSEYNIFNEE